jgi:hypothetical protein
MWLIARWRRCVTLAVVAVAVLASSVAGAEDDMGKAVKGHG